MGKHFHLVSETPRGERRRKAEAQGELEPQGWCVGGEEFRQELLAQVSELASPRHAGEEIRHSALSKAQRIAQEEQDALGWTTRELEGRPKSDPGVDSEAVVHGIPHLRGLSPTTPESEIAK